MNNNNLIYVDELISSAKVNARHIVIIISILLITLFDGYDTFIPAYTISEVVKPWGVNPNLVGTLVSSGLLGFLIGSLGCGFLADKIGRRTTLIFALIWAGFFSLLTGQLADSYSLFIVLRVLTGIGLGALLPVATTYINEIAPAKVSNAVTVLGAMGFAFGGITASFVAIGTIEPFGWQFMYDIGGLAIIMGLVVRFVIPESPKFLNYKITIKEGKQSKKYGDLIRGLSELNKAYSYNFLKENVELRKYKSNEKDSGFSGLFKALFSKDNYLMRKTLLIWTAAFCVLFQLYALGGWLPVVLLRRGFPQNEAFLVGAVTLGSGVIGSIAFGYIADKFLNRKTVIAIASLLTTIVAFLFINADTLAFNLFLAGLLGALIVGGQYILNNLTAHTYETKFRGRAQGLELGVGRLGAIMGPTLVSLMGVNRMGGDATFSGLFILVIIAGVVGFFAMLLFPSDAK